MITRELELPLEGPLDGIDARLQGFNPSEFTRKWWNGLPGTYRRADANEGDFTMLRYMDGAGACADAVERLVDQWWDGTFADPERTPDGGPLNWLALLLGVGRGGTAAETRERVRSVAESGRAPAGSRQAIADATRTYLSGTRQVRVNPSKTDKWQIIVYVREDELPAPGGTTGTAAVAAALQAHGVAPAGYRLTVKAAVSSWDAWEADAGATWTEAEANIPTWAASDSAGVVLE